MSSKRKAETFEHKRVKTILEDAIQRWYNGTVSRQEFPIDGHRADIFSVISGNTTILTEIIWSHSSYHFVKDIVLLLRTPGDVKVVVGSPLVLSDKKMQDEFKTTCISQKIHHDAIMSSEMLDGESILRDTVYLNSTVRSHIDNLLEEFNKLNNPLVIDSIDCSGVEWNNDHKISAIVRNAGKSVVEQLTADIQIDEDNCGLNYVYVDFQNRYEERTINDLHCCWSLDGSRGGTVRDKLDILHSGKSSTLTFPDLSDDVCEIIDEREYWDIGYLHLNPFTAHKISITVTGACKGRTVNARKDLMIAQKKTQSETDTK